MKTLSPKAEITVDSVERMTRSICAVRNTNSKELLTNRHKALIEELQKIDMPYELDYFSINGFEGVNIILRGTSDKMLTAHIDVVNENADNAWDNTCSVVCCVMAKVLCPDITVVLTDLEEWGGKGAEDLALRINAGEFGFIRYNLNLELCAAGGSTSFFIENPRDSVLSKEIMTKFPQAEVYNPPFSDAVRFRQAGIDSVTINTLPRLEDGSLDFSLLQICHSQDDSVDSVSFPDMLDFIENLLQPLLLS